jgi:hypothetical protein
MELVEDIIADTKYVDKYLDFCRKRNIDKDVSEGKVVGDKWYTNFIWRDKDELKVGRCRVQDVTWCTKDHFRNMYDSVYESMVGAGVATKLDEE